MATDKPVRGRPNDKVRRAVSAYFELQRADALVDRATALQDEALTQFNSATRQLNSKEMERYVTLVEKHQNDEDEDED